MKYCIKTKELITPTVCRLVLSPLEKNLNFQAGQYIEFVLSEKELVPFSIANAPCEKGVLEFFVRLEEKDLLLQRLFNLIDSNQPLTLLGPFGDCVFAQATRNTVILLAGGVGVTQAKALLEQAIQEKDVRAFHLYWSVSSAEDLFLQDQLLAWQQTLPHFTFQTYVASGSAAIKKIAADFTDLSQCDVYSSGPWAMTDQAYALFSQHGLPKAQMHSDRFAFE